MKLRNFRWIQIQNIYENMLTLETEQDVLAYAKEEAKRQSLDFEHCLTVYLRDNHRTWENVTAHCSDTKITHVATVAVLSKKDECDLVEIANKVDEIVSDKIQGMLKAIRNNQTVYINANGGYHFRDNNDTEIEILSSIEIDEKDLHNFIWSVKNNEKKVAWKKTNFCYYKGQTYDGGTHAFICAKYNLDEDKCLKLIWDKTGMEYGIEGCNLSPVYETVVPPFIPTKQDLDVIEKTCKEYKKNYRGI